MHALRGKTHDVRNIADGPALVTGERVGRQNTPLEDREDVLPERVRLPPVPDESAEDAQPVDGASARGRTARPRSTSQLAGAEAPRVLIAVRATMRAATATMAAPITTLFGSTAGRQSTSSPWIT